RWIEAQRRPARADATVARGRQVFETTACVNCHAVGGTNANGRFGPDLSHFMSRDTLAAGAAPNTPENLRLWLRNPSAMKPGSLMTAMQLSDEDVNAVADYLESLRRRPLRSPGRTPTRHRGRSSSDCTSGSPPSTTSASGSCTSSTPWCSW